MNGAWWFVAGVCVGAPLLVTGGLVALIWIANLMDRVEEERNG